MSVGENIKTYRKNKHLTQKQLADKIGLSEITIRRYEKNTNVPTIEILNKISEVLDVSTNNLLNPHDKSKYELEEALLNGDGNISKLVSNFENSAKEESVKSFRNLIEVLDWKAFKDINDDDIYDVINSHELYNYLRFLFFEKLNKKI